MPPCQARSARWKVLAACLGSGLLAAGNDEAGAADWQVLYRLTETLSASDNIEFSADPAGAGFSSHSGAGLDISALTPTSTWSANGDIGQLYYFGEGAPEDRKRTIVAARSDLLKRTRSTDFTLNAYFRMVPATGAQLSDVVLPEPDLTDIGLELVDFDRISYGAGGGLLHRRTRRDDFALNARADRVDFTGDALNAIPHSSVELSGEWTRRLSPILDGRALTSVEHFRPDDEDAAPRRMVYDVAVGTNLRATRRLTLDANAGLAIIDPQDSAVKLGLVGDLDLIYTPRRDTVMTLALSQDVAPDSLGELRTSQAARGAVTYRINEVSSFTVMAAYTTSTATGEGGDDRDAWSISPNYSRALTRNWDLSLSYRWLKSDIARSNTAFLTLSHRGAILP